MFSLYNYGYSSGEYSSEDDGSDVDREQFDNKIRSYFSKLKYKRRKRLKKVSGIQGVQKHMHRVFSRESVLFCVDIEAWERNTDVITEIGVSIYDPRHQELALTPNIKTYHISISENRHVKNGQFVPEHSQNFSGASTHVLTLNEARWLLQGLVDHYFDESLPIHCSLVGHDLNGDLKWLARLGVRIRANVRKLDTQTVFAYTHGQEGASLKNALRRVNQPFAFLHNAGNDAYFTIMLALKLCDPSVRQLTRIDFLRDGEVYGKPVKYEKIDTNKSTEARDDVYDILTDATNQLSL